MDNFTEQLQKLAEFAEATSIWHPADVTQEPHVRLTQWQVYLVKAALGEDGGDTIHFNGYTQYEGRVSSPVLTYDKVTKRGVTRSGRIYELVDESGWNKDAMYVWNRWVNMVNNPETINVSDQYE